MIPIPEDIARVARAAFPRGNLYMRLRDALGLLFTDEAFAPLFAARGPMIPMASYRRTRVVCTVFRPW
jgi:hypothetical protein